jgi:hypothetical protein
MEEHRTLNKCGVGVRNQNFPNSALWRGKEAPATNLDISLTNP